MWKVHPQTDAIACENEENSVPFVTKKGVAVLFNLTGL